MEFLLIITDIIAQIEQKYELERTKKILSQVEHDEQKKKDEMHQQNIRSVIASKIKTMRDSNIPESIIRDIEKQLNLNLK